LLSSLPFPSPLLPFFFPKPTFFFDSFTPSIQLLDLRHDADSTNTLHADPSHLRNSQN
jgi:hypothetical protein